MPNESILHVALAVVLLCLALLIAIVIAWEPLAAIWPTVFAI